MRPLCAGLGSTQANPRTTFSGCRRGHILFEVSRPTPQHKVLPKNFAMQRGKSARLKPFTRDGIRNTCQHRKLFYVQRLIRITLAANLCDANSPELFVVSHGLGLVAVTEFNLFFHSQVAIQSL